MAKLGIDKDFLADFARLERSVQARVARVFGKFENATHAGIHLERIENAHDDRFRSIRIDRFWRGIVLAPASGESYTLLKVLPHDDAYQWARRRRASVNAATGAIEIRDVEAIAGTLPALSSMAEQAADLLFADVKDSTLRRLGVDEQTRAFARVVTDVTQLEAARAFLPAAQWDVLYGLAAGLTPEDVWTELGAPNAIRYDPEDLDAAVARSVDRVVLVDGPAELMAVFEHPFALWRIYLHPTQQTIVESGYRGPARVTGGPGTGKTVVALHRAVHLATWSGGPVLITTFTSTLSGSLSAGVKLLARTPEIIEQIEVLNVDKVANRIFREQHGTPKIISSHEERALWAIVVRDLDVGFREVFLMEEWRQVILAQKIRSADQYLNADRTGRGRLLGRRQKELIWQAVWEFETKLRSRNAWTHETVCVEATRLLEQRKSKPYRHIVVDEAQDLSAVRWRFLRAAVPNDLNDLFMAGDTHQRIYQDRVSLGSLGIAVTGRSTRLKLNYRTTAEILRWSLGLLHGEPVDDMDGGLEAITGYRSVVHGFAPDVRGFSNEDRELEALNRTIEGWIEAGVGLDEIGVAARSRNLVGSVVRALTEQSITAFPLSENEPVPDAVSVGTMHRMKGLEFRCLAVVGVSDRQVPASGAVTRADEDEQAHRQDLLRERSLLFVACTRARERLSVTWHGAPSPFLVECGLPPGEF